VLEEYFSIMTVPAKLLALQVCVRSAKKGW